MQKKIADQLELYRPTKVVEHTGVALATLRRVKAGKPVRQATLKRLADFLGIQWEDK